MGWCYRSILGRTVVEDAPLIPILTLGPISVSTHDVFSMLGLAVGLAIYYVELRRRHWLEPRIVWISLAAIVGGAIGARVITAWEHLEYYSALEGVPLTWAIEHSGKSLIGAIAGGYLGIALAKRATGCTRSTGDAYVLAIPVATVIGRIGCYLSELPLGTPTDLPWGVSVPAEAAAAFARCPGCTLPMHPSMLYEIAFNLVAIAVLLRYRDRIPVPGDALKLYLLAAGCFRLWVETVRGNEVQALGLTGPQWVLAPLVGLLVLHFVRQVWRGAYRVAAAPVPPDMPASQPAVSMPVASGEARSSSVDRSSSHGRAEVHP
jgi:phosphatidylglycerol:prolipoprotein diacylglycerol transferase